LIISETLATAEAHVLVVCPAALRAQWQEELEQRFGLRARVLDAAGLAAADATLPAGVNPWSAAPLLVTSIDFVKRPDIIRALEPIVWDVVVFDEAHALAGRSDRATAAAALARRARAVVMLTATPHSGDAEAFARLCGLGHLDGDPPLATFRRPSSILGPRLPRRMTTLCARQARRAGAGPGWPAGTHGASAPCGVERHLARAVARAPHGPARRRGAAAGAAARLAIRRVGRR
jgi:hypothetical protein